MNVNLLKNIPKTFLKWTRRLFLFWWNECLRFYEGEREKQILSEYLCELLFFNVWMFFYTEEKFVWNWEGKTFFFWKRVNDFLFCINQVCFIFNFLWGNLLSFISNTRKEFFSCVNPSDVLWNEAHGKIKELNIFSCLDKIIYKKNWLKCEGGNLKIFKNICIWKKWKKKSPRFSICFPLFFFFLTKSIS